MLVNKCHASALSLIGRSYTTQFAEKKKKKKTTQLNIYGKTRDIYRFKERIRSKICLNLCPPKCGIYTSIKQMKR